MGEGGGGDAVLSRQFYGQLLAKTTAEGSERKQFRELTKKSVLTKIYDEEYLWHGFAWR